MGIGHWAWGHHFGHRYLAVSAVSEIVCIEPNPYLQKRLRASARAVVEERRARRGPPLTVRVYAGTLCEYADEETLVEFDAVVCVLVLCSVTRLGAELAAAVRLLKAGGALYYVEHVGAESGPARRALLRAVQPLWSLLGGGFQVCRDTHAALGRQPGLYADRERLEERRHSLCAGLIPLICGVCRAVKPDAASERTARMQRRERARSPVRRRGHHWEVSSNRNVVVVVAR